MPPRIAVLGSCTVDLVMHVPRQPLPGETLFVDSAALLPGGKGLNQAIAAARLGAEVALLGLVGDDPLADVLLRAAVADGIDTAYLRRDPAKETGIAVPVVMPSGDNSILAAPRANLELSVADVEAAAPALRACDVFVFQLETPIEAVLAAARLARAAGAIVLMNPAPAREIPDDLFTLSDVLVLNEVEAAVFAPGALDEAEQAAALMARGPRLVVVTLGARGGVACDASGCQPFAAFAVDVVDSVGAGDAFCGALAVALAERLDTAAAVRFANGAAALSLTGAGAITSLPRRAELAAFLAGRV